MYIQEYGDRAMGLWGSIITGLAGLAGNYLANKMATKQAESSEEYKNAFSDANKSIGMQQALAGQYTGNEGYANSLEQAGKGAGTIANQAVGLATSGARNAGMSKAQAAQMGLQSGNQAYANAFQNQQGVAQQQGLNRLNAQGNITGAYQGQAGTAQGERQSQYNRAADTMGRVSQAVGDVAKEIGQDVAEFGNKKNPATVQESVG